jgi:5-methylthioadenosine/S-adenosylhomocysteine deaminase
MTRDKYDLIIHNGTAVTVNAGFDIIASALICINNGVIHSIKAATEGSPLPDAVEVVNAGGGIIMPGLVNTHTHLPMTLFRGLADDLPLDTWLNEHMFPVENEFITPENVRWGTLLACLEMLLSGTTTCCGGYFLEDYVASAVVQTGLRAVLAQGVIDFPAPGVPDPALNVAHAAGYVDKWMDRAATVTPSIFCHSPYTCGAKTLTAAKDAANRKGVLFQVHAAETKQETENSFKEHGLSPVGYLDSLGILDENTLAVHAVWTDKTDIRILEERRVKISHNAESNMKLAAGIAPVPAFLDAGLTVGLGTDGCASNNDLDLFGEMDSVAKIHKATALDPTVMDAATVLKMATIDGARAIGLGHMTGSLEPGKQADIIVVKTSQPHLVPLYSPVSHIVYSMRGADVSTVVAGGKILIRNRKAVHLDQERILGKVMEIAGKIKSKCK